MIPSRVFRPGSLVFVFLGLVTLATVFAQGCDKAALTAPTDSTIVLFANATSIPLNGSADITAQVLESAGTQVQNGTSVTFSTTLGSIEPAEARTRDGKVSVRFNAGTRSGTATITAFSGAARADALEILVGGAAVDRVMLSASPTTVSPGGGTVQLIATVLDESGNRVSGVPVSFSSTAGVLGVSSVVSDGNGEARTSLTTSRQAEVTATAGAVDSSAITVRVAAAPTITITTLTSSPTPGQPVTFQVSVNPSADGAPIREVTIDFGDGDQRSLGALTGTQQILHIFESGGTYTVTVTATDRDGERVSVSTVVSVVRTAVAVNLTASPNTTAVNQPVTFTTTVSPATTAVSSFLYSFGDGTQRSTNSGTTTHAYATTGTKVVRVTVFTADGGSYVAETEVVVR
jgi:hypothetical protein